LKPGFQEQGLKPGAFKLLVNCVELAQPHLERVVAEARADLLRRAPEGMREVVPAPPVAAVQVAFVKSKL
jgi:hypothetical protein